MKFFEKKFHNIGKTYIFISPQFFNQTSE
uniref:Uncharacterized protein n=1 Tax=Arundo donax TaxID=35708 RepID=A0A0A9FX11_ARUDO